MAVTGTITITTLLFFYIVRHQWGKPLWLVLAGAGALPRRRPAVPRREPDQAHPRRVAAAADRRRRVHGADHLAARPRAGHRAARARRGVAARVRRRAARAPPAAAARPGHRGLPQPRQDDHAAGDARQRRAQPHPARARRDPLDRDAAGARTSRRPTGSRSTTSATPTTASPTSAPASATWTRPTSPACCALAAAAGLECPLEVDEASYFLSTIELQRRRRARHEPLAQAPVRRDLAASPPTPPSTSACRASARSSWARGSRCRKAGA